MMYTDINLAQPPSLLNLLTFTNTGTNTTITTARGVVHNCAQQHNIQVSLNQTPDKPQTSNNSFGSQQTP